MLIKEHNFEEDSLTDQCATREKILNAFAKLIRDTLPGDTVRVYFSGQSIPESRREAFGIKSSKELYIILNHKIKLEFTFDAQIYDLNKI